MIIKDYNNQRIVELVLYVLNKGQGLTQYYLYKILYFAERKHLARWGHGILPGEFHAWEKGPVPKRIYGGIKNYSYGSWPLDVAFREVISRADKDMGDYLIPLRKPNMDYISQSETEVIDESFDENIGLTVPQLIEKSHDSAWRKSWAKGRDEVMPSVDIAEAEGIDNDMLEYIAEMEAVRYALEK